MKKVVLFNGSPRKNGNTSILLGRMSEIFEKRGMSAKTLQVGGRALRGCIACGKCMEKQDRKCHLPDDGMNELIEAAIEADGIVIGSPVYFSNVTAEVKALIDRVGFVTRVCGTLLRRKVGASVISVRRAGGCAVFSDINYFYLINEMIVPGSSYWNLAIGRDPGEVETDEEGIRTIETLGDNMAWLLERI